MALTVGELVAFLRLDDSQFNKGLDKGQQRLQRVGEGMSSAGRAMSLGVTLPAIALGAVSVKLAATFEKSMNQVQYATGATNKQMAGLSDYAKKMGADTIFSAGEAAQAMVDLAKSGMTPAQIAGGGLKAAMDLAAAGEMALADAAVVTSNAMNTFNLSAKDAPSIAAALAGGANASTAEVSDLAQGMAMSGAQAKLMGLSLQENVAVLAMFADKGLSGSDAGTSFKTMLMRLVPQTDKQATAMKRLGLNFVDSKGNVDDVATVAQKLQDRLGGLSQAQKVSALNTIFGSDASRAAFFLMESGSAGLEKYTKATKNQAAATGMAAALTKGLGGALERMKGSLENVALIIGENLSPYIRTAAGLLEKMANAFSSMPKWAQKSAVGIGIFVAALGPALLVAGKFALALNQIRQFRMARKGIGKVTDVLGDVTSKGGVLGDAALKGAISANTLATEQNTLALGGKGLPGKGGSPVGTIGKVAAGGGLASAGTVIGLAAGSVIAGVTMGEMTRRYSSPASTATVSAARMGGPGGRMMGSQPSEFLAQWRSAMGKVRAEAAKPIRMARLNTSGITGPLSDAAAHFAAFRTDMARGITPSSMSAHGAAAKPKPRTVATTNPWTVRLRSRHAAGGIVSGPEVALIGEAGPEAIIPLTRPRRAAQVMAQAGLSGRGGDIHIHIGTVVGTDRAAAEKMAAMVGKVLQRGVRYANA